MHKTKPHSTKKGTRSPRRQCGTLDVADGALLVPRLCPDSAVTFPRWPRCIKIILTAFQEIRVLVTTTFSKMFHLEPNSLACAIPNLRQLSRRTRRRPRRTWCKCVCKSAVEIAGSATRLNELWKRTKEAEQAWTDAVADSLSAA